MNIRIFQKCILTLLVGCAITATAKTSARKTVSLDGTWQIAEGSLTNVPSAFDRRVPVPGLVDMAQPPFVEPGPKVADREQGPQKDTRRDAFWYRRMFTIEGVVPPVATLKVGKAMFGTRVILNGQLLGDHAPSFTPGFFAATTALKSGENELLIRIGADSSAVPRVVPSGRDGEKQRYIPGIFDSVELILSGTPTIENVQVAPDLTNRQARVRVWLKQATVAGEATVEVREAKSRKLAGQTSARLTAAAAQTLDLTVPVSGCHLWSPEDPFLYEITVRTASDEFTTRFGMREFKFDRATGRAMLNGKPYFMRGSNFTLYRFFEDPDRGSLPWNEDWVRTLHRRVKDMHWNCLRYCIGFPPEAWYRIADEEGILIQDEFPIWNMDPKPGDFDPAELAQEYTEWMQEHWNHPCVVIWDACNETPERAHTGEAIQQVRHLDLSNRPWDNGWAPAQASGDVFESHPYFFCDANYKLASIATRSGVPQGNVCLHNSSTHPVIINEYGWLWLNRDGTPTTLTADLYQNLLGKNSTAAQRQQLYARYLAAETEFWRSHRAAAAVMHFTTLGYSRPDGQTSDHWLDVKTLKWEPEFYRHVRDAFAPVGVMIDAWAADYAPGKLQDFPVVVINDLETSWKGDVRFRILRAGKVVAEQKTSAEVAGLGSSTISFKIKIPEQAGSYQAEAALLATPAGLVRSLRDFVVPH